MAGLLIDPADTTRKIFKKGDPLYAVFDPAAGGSFAPDDIAGLQFWLDAADAATLFQDEAGTTPAVANDAPVGRWADKSGSNWHLTSPNAVSGGDGTNRPALKTNILNGKPVIRTNGSIHFMRATNAAITGTSLTVFVVTKRIAFVNANEALMSLASTGAEDFDNVESTVIGHSVAASAPFPQLNGDISDSRDDVILSDCAHAATGTAFVYSSKYNGTNQTGYINGVAATPVATTGTFSVEKISIGFRNTPASISNPNNRDYAEILIYNSALSNTDREAVEAYLIAKWGIS
jgi:hypothetical protein